jgi:hypothetical protein
MRMGRQVHINLGRACAQLLAAATLSITVSAGAMVFTPKQGPEVKPGPEHAIFKEWAGNWDAEMPGGSKGTTIAKVGLNGLWLMDDLKSEIGGMPFEGRGALSYDPAKKKYVHVWIDSMSTSPMISEGTYDKATKTLTLNGTMAGPDGMSMKVRQVLVTKDADTRVFTLSSVGDDGAATEMIVVTYKRKK